MGRRWTAASPTPPEPEQCELPTDRRFSTNLAQAGQAKFAGGLMVKRRSRRRRRTITRATQKSPDSKRMSGQHVRILIHCIRCLQLASLVMLKQPKIQGCNRRRASQKFVAKQLTQNKNI